MSVLEAEVTDVCTESEKLTDIRMEVCDTLARTDLYQIRILISNPEMTDIINGGD
jgi:hypothetical protein